MYWFSNALVSVVAIILFFVLFFFLMWLLFATPLGLILAVIFIALMVYVWVATRKDPNG